MSLYEALYGELAKSLSAEDSEFVAGALSVMPRDEIERLFKAVDEYEPSEAEQGLIPIPAGYAEQ